MTQLCEPCRGLVCKPWQNAPHASLRAIRDGHVASAASGGARRTQYSCAACTSSLVRLSAVRSEPGWRIGAIDGAEPARIEGRADHHQNIMQPPAPGSCIRKYGYEAHASVQVSPARRGRRT